MAQGIPSNMLKKLCAIATVGTSIEWYDFYIYGTASALVFPTLFSRRPFPRWPHFWRHSQRLLLVSLRDPSAELSSDILATVLAEKKLWYRRWC